MYTLSPVLQGAGVLILFLTIVKGQVVNKAQEIKVLNGNPLRLECRLLKSLDTLIWKHNDEIVLQYDNHDIISNSSEFSIKVDIGQSLSILRKLRIGFIHEGIYSCIQNGLTSSGKQKDTWVIRVKGRLTLTLNNSQFSQGQIISATCCEEQPDSNEYEDVVFIWTINDEPLALISEHYATTTGGQCTCTHRCSKVTFYADQEHNGLHLVCRTQNITWRQSTVLLRVSDKKVQNFPLVAILASIGTVIALSCVFLCGCMCFRKSENVLNPDLVTFVRTTGEESEVETRHRPNTDALNDDRENYDLVEPPKSVSSSEKTTTPSHCDDRSLTVPNSKESEKLRYEVMIPRAGQKQCKYLHQSQDYVDGRSYDKLTHLRH